MSTNFNDHLARLRALSSGITETTRIHYRLYADGFTASVLTLENVRAYVNELESYTGREMRHVTVSKFNGPLRIGYKVVRDLDSISTKGV